MDLINFSEFRWQLDAACAEHPEVDFFAEDEASMASAREICDRCVVQIECEAFVRSRGEPYGVWGGLSAQDRGATVRSNCGTESGYKSHLYYNDDVCPACRQAVNEASKRAGVGYRARRKAGLPLERAASVIRPSCGTDSGYRIHRNHNEDSCAACSEAHREVTRQSMAALRARRQVSAAQALAGEP